ncbi:MAG: hypothetical protein FWE13_01595 [Firmicutes bacterium]|nr:hypothetical protein [Bacillota bacterium]
MENEFLKLVNKEGIKNGTCVYGSIEYEVKIVKWHNFYGTGDYEDFEEIREDRAVECYYVFYEDLANKGSFNSGGGCFLTIQEAIMSIESNVNVKWSN